VVNVNTLTLTESTSARVIILGVGKVELRIAATTGNSLLIGEITKFGALPSDTSSSLAPAPAGRLIVYVNSSATGEQTSSAVFADEAAYFSATPIVPNGKIYLKEAWARCTVPCWRTSCILKRLTPSTLTRREPPIRSPPSRICGPGRIS
jgi:hypothetical protein